MATSKAITANAKKNNGGTVMYGGAIGSSAPISQALGMTTVGFDRSRISVVPSPETDATIAAGTDTKATYKPYTSGTFAYTPARVALVRGYSTTISGVANSALTFPASDVGIRKSIHKKEVFRTLKQSTWNWITGQASVNTIEVLTYSNDEAARPSRSVPGELVIMETGTTPTYKDYSGKTG